jgi:hypothetical protein
VPLHNSAFLRGYGRRVSAILLYLAACGLAPSSGAAQGETPALTGQYTIEELARSNDDVLVSLTVTATNATNGVLRMGALVLPPLSDEDLAVTSLTPGAIVMSLGALAENASVTVRTRVTMSKPEWLRLTSAKDWRFILESRDAEGGLLRRVVTLNLDRARQGGGR